jgi:hypothetical protein
MKLIFVYNAGSGIFNTVKDIGHKLFSPQTYDCFLCSLTHGTFSEQPSWKSFRESSPIEMEFLHRDEFERRYDRRENYPVVMKESDSIEIILSRERLAELSSLDELIQTIKDIA